MLRVFRAKQATRVMSNPDETDPLLQQDSPSFWSRAKAFSSNHIEIIMMASWFMILCLLGTGLIHSNMPLAITSPDQRDVLIGKRASGTFGWDILKNITAVPHCYNSEANLKVRSELIKTLYQLEKQYKEMNCSTPNPFRVPLYNLDSYCGSYQYDF